MNYYHINTFMHSHIHAFFLPSSWVLCAFFVAITYLLKTSTLRVQIIQDGKSLIFNHKVGDPSAILRRSLGDHFIVTLPFSTTVEKNILPCRKLIVFLQNNIEKK